MDRAFFQSRRDIASWIGRLDLDGVIDAACCNDGLRLMHLLGNLATATPINASL